MHSTDYVVARCLSVRPSVCHTPVLCLNGYAYSQSFSPSGSPTILVFPRQTGWQYSDGDPPNGGVECKQYSNGDPPNGGVECKEGMKKHDFLPISCFIAQMMQDRAIVTMEGE